ncbi:hypothetical protein RDABS01_040034 [Bienertia sinuspersici]
MIMFRVTQKLKKTKEAFKKLNREEFSEIGARYRSVRKISRRCRRNARRICMIKVLLRKNRRG